jgi:hypothetical protein
MVYVPKWLEDSFERQGLSNTDLRGRVECFIERRIGGFLTDEKSYRHEALRRRLFFDDGKRTFVGPFQNLAEVPDLILPILYKKFCKKADEAL